MPQASQYVNNVEVKKLIKSLQEIQIRLVTTNEFIIRKKTTGYLGTDVEFISLQFRKIIELIALSSIIVNKKKYSENKTKFQNDWNARLIFQDLERINPKFYPLPTKSKKNINKNGEVAWEQVHIEKGFLTKKEAIKIYKKCNGVLHAENPFKNPKNFNQLYKQLPYWLKSLTTLLNHYLVTLDNDDIFICQIPMNMEKKVSVVYCGKMSTERTKEYKNKFNL